MTVTGRVVTEGSRVGQRFCDAHGCQHGPLYICPSYPEEVQAEIRAQDQRFRANLADPKWCRGMSAAGVPRVAIDLFKAMGGVKP